MSNPIQFLVSNSTRKEYIRVRSPSTAKSIKESLEKMYPDRSFTLEPVSYHSPHDIQALNWYRIKCNGVTINRGMLKDLLDE